MKLSANVQARVKVRKQKKIKRKKREKQSVTDFKHTHTHACTHACAHSNEYLSKLINFCNVLCAMRARAHNLLRAMDYAIGHVDFTYYVLNKLIQFSIVRSLLNVCMCMDRLRACLHRVSVAVWFVH